MPDADFAVTPIVWLHNASCPQRGIIERRLRSLGALTNTCSCNPLRGVAYRVELPGPSS